MPRKTFDNLPDEKRRRFVTAAIDVFSESPYRQASITQLVARLGIAKGSVYQYFDNKQALYRWLLTTEVERHRKLHMRGAAPEAQDPFASLRRYGAANVAFHLAEPKLARLHRFAFSPTRDPELRELFAQLRRTHHMFFRSFLERGQQAGSIRPDIDNELAARVVANTVGDSLVDTALSELGCDLASYLDLPFGAADALTEDRTRGLVDSAVDVVKNAYATPHAIVGALESGQGLAIGEGAPPPSRDGAATPPLGVVFDDDDAGALADEWWTPEG